jgi:beta-galactosidase
VGAGGPIIAMQVENEYGSYGNDHLYLRHLELQFRQQQIDAILFSSNGYSSSSATLTSTETLTSFADDLYRAGDQMLVGGALPSLLRTVNFGTGADVEGNLKVLRKYQPSGPLFVTEFWYRVSCVRVCHTCARRARVRARVVR